MANKMLIDASQPEETRIVVLRGNRVEEFDFEAASRKQLRGNIYLAKVTRVEPSLQAAFVEYGGNRHGFLAFAEIHPDYYQIPVADRQALMEEEARAQAEENDEERPAPRSRRNRHDDGSDTVLPHRATGDATISEPSSEPELPLESADDAEVPPAYAEAVADEDKFVADDQGEGDVGEDIVSAGENAEDSPAARPDRNQRGRGRRSRNGNRGGRDRAAASDDVAEDSDTDSIEQMGGDAMEELPYRAPRLRRQYKIQEVIKRRQVLLIQVVKEERGNKGAALTTYLSLAGRYSVLMPNTARGGGISRKITDTTDRKRLKEIVQDLEVPEGMGIILRTAGASRTKPEVKRDFEYLLRMWETVRELTLKSSAPMLVYEEGSLIKRAIRDLYNKDIDEVVVAGDEGYREAKEFMRLLMPSHAKNVQPYKDSQPIFAKAGAEAQLDAMFSSQVTLKSGGYIVINQTEALVAIDVNSGRSTREHNIEDTAVRTNLEAADEVARQLRLRDLAGLIVVDFIDMDENRNNRSVERRMKDALANDRARIQVGRISHFGLLEMSRQRIRTGVLEGSTVMCSHCAGAGMVRSTPSLALHVIRVLEDALIKSASHNLFVRTRSEVALYVLNQKRMHLFEMEQRFGVTLTVAADDTLTGSVYHAIERGEPAIAPPAALVMNRAVRIDSIQPEEPEVVEDEAEWAEAEEVAQPEPQRQGAHRREGQRHSQRDAGRGPERAAEPGAERPTEDGEVSRRRRRRKRRRGGGADREIVQNFAPGAPQPYQDGQQSLQEGAAAVTTQQPFEDAEITGLHEVAMMPAALADIPVVSAPEGEAPARRSRRAKGPATARTAKAKPEVAAEVIEAAKPAPAKRPGRKPKAKAEETKAVSETPMVAAIAAAPPVPVAIVEPTAAIMMVPEAATPPAPKPEPIPDAPAGPKRSGWWQRAKAATFGGD